MALQKYVTEFIGTFFLVAIIGLSVTPGGADKLAPLAIGAGLMALVFMGGHASGAHYNPAVSLAVLVRRKMAIADFIPYIIAQVAGATLAAWVVHYLRDAGSSHVQFGVHPADSNIGHAFLAEFLFTFALALVVVNVATAPKNAGNSFYGIAIGFIVTAGAYCVGGISGGAFNPSVGTGPALIEMAFGAGGAALKDLWLYWVACMLGGLIAGLVCNFQVCEKSKASA